MVASSELPARKAARFDARLLVRALVGERPLVLLCFVSPTLLAVAIDVALRPRSLLAFEPLQWFNYFGSSMASSAVARVVLVWAVADAAGCPPKVAEAVISTSGCGRTMANSRRTTPAPSIVMDGVILTWSR